ncbi:orexin receptor type 2 isoform X2 [Nasonia vitripennis]|uniref:G-protein coupled receptors family 1 profile domain-containing protein n=1 Tax=Nasonia vitripennis TaxID=7425 RepID=A0A7M7LVF7_NASVI|nr:orexin receptor type 2 isoform X2 [Nasonia vitripennis]
MESLVVTALTFLATSASGETSEAEDDSANDSLDPASNCTNNLCISEDEYLDEMHAYIYPKSYEWVLIVLHCIVFIVGLVGNALVCLAVYRNHTMRTVTNYFIVNLAVADLLVIIICLPPTILWDITETWFLGLMPCKIVLYLQTVSVSVSVLTLTFISIDRWYAICFPLRFKSTTSRAKTAIIIIWVMALLFDIPDLLVFYTHQDRKLHGKTILFTQCLPSWSRENQIAFNIIKLILLYTGPLMFMSFAYCQIVRVLWRNDIPGHNLSTRIINANDLSSQSNVGNPEGQLKSRRKAAKMLVAVVLMFAVCCFPVHLLNILRSSIVIRSSDLVNITSCLVHWLYYANSAINPLIYNFMSGKFRREFKRTFCCPRGGGSHNRAVYRMAARKSSHSAPSARGLSSRVIIIRSSDKAI